MTPTRRRFLGAATATTAVGLAGCLGGDGEADQTTTETDAPETTTTAETAATTTEMAEDDGSGATVRVASHPDYGEVLVDGEGMTLYMFDSDERGAGASTCSGGCLEAWPPLTSDGEPGAGDAVTADLTTFDRGDGTTQVAANGWPLYYFASDESAGDASGQGVSDVWWVLGPDGEPIRSMGGSGDDESGASAANESGGGSGSDGSGSGSGGPY